VNNRSSRPNVGLE